MCIYENRCIYVKRCCTSRQGPPAVFYKGKASVNIIMRISVEIFGLCVFIRRLIKSHYIALDKANG